MWTSSITPGPKYSKEYLSQSDPIDQQHIPIDIPLHIGVISPLWIQLTIHMINKPANYKFFVQPMVQFSFLAHYFVPIRCHHEVHYSHYLGCLDCCPGHAL